MKNITLLLVFVAGITVNAFGQQSFSSASIDIVQGREILSFSLPNETNVRHYRIEASNDERTFEVIGTLPSRGVSMLKTTYKYDLAGHSYKYYRVGIVRMDAGQPYSDVVISKKYSLPQPQEDKNTEGSSNVLAHQ